MTLLFQLFIFLTYLLSIWNSIHKFTIFVNNVSPLIGPGGEKFWRNTTNQYIDKYAYFLLLVAALFYVISFLASCVPWLWINGRRLK